MKTGEARVQTAEGAVHRRWPSPSRSPSPNPAQPSPREGGTPPAARGDFFLPLLLTLVAALLLTVPPAAAASPPTLEARQEGIALRGGAVELEITVAGVPEGETVPVEVLAGAQHIDRLSLAAGTHAVTLDADVLPAGTREITLRSGTVTLVTGLRRLPGWVSVVPPVVAIALALAFKDVLISLFVGVLVGALFLTGGNPFSALARTVDSFLVPSLADPDHAKIIVFSLLLGGMVGVISKSGGTRGIVERLARYATDPRSGQVATWVMGILIFFDDYANTLIVGSTMRPVTDRLKISREKLAYIVDSTAAPVASVVPISTWIGFEVGLIATALDQLALPGQPYNAYGVFVASIPYRFYPIFALVLGFTIAATRRDFGPMLLAERRAQLEDQVIASGDVPLADYQSQKLEPPEGIPHRALNAFVPILTVIAVTLGGLFVTGSVGLERSAFPSTVDWLREVFANSDSYASLLWASLSGVVVAILLPLAQRLVPLQDSMTAMLEGFKAMLLAMVVLVLAWSIGSICAELHTAEFLVRSTSGVLSPHWVPVIVFALSAAVAFATGTSWGAMAILMPLVIPLIHGISTHGGHPAGSPEYTIFLVGTVSSVLAGTVWGDHCSPISDTTILSSMASGSDHIAHVRTQLPYAVVIGLLGMAVGDIPTAFGLSPWISLAAGTTLIVAGVLWLAPRVDGQKDAVRG